ncbi:hypothetical protein [uncultured Roseibium sp.]|uniref:hypothetical protein n=1 Tax=uncultured Roseibium sp. TaxID=1936171 RepID=UPI0026357DF3|nr:hypothetical protein [uncultured Roseibium sp.]
MLTKIKTTRLLKHKNSTTVLVNEGDNLHEYQMSIPAGDPDGEGSLGWRLNYHGKPLRADVMAAISIMESYEYLLSESITADEAINRLRCLRREYKNQFSET